MKWLSGVWDTFVRFGFRLLYNEMAWTYDVVSWLVSLGEWRRWQLASLDFLPDPADDRPRLLEIGHGPGHMLAESTRRGFLVSGCDASRFMGRMAHARLGRAGFDAYLVRAAVPNLPFADGQFDVILSQFPTVYVLWEETAATAFRLLRPGGRLVVLPEGHLTGRSPVHRFISWLFRITGQTTGDQNELENNTLMAMWTPWRERYEAAGFTVNIYEVVLERSRCTVLVAKKDQIV